MIGRRRAARRNAGAGGRRVGSPADNSSNDVGASRIDHCRARPGMGPNLNGQTPTNEQLAPYIDDDGNLSCPGGGAEYTIGAVGEKASCTIHGNKSAPIEQ